MTFSFYKRGQEFIICPCVYDDDDDNSV